MKRRRLWILGGCFMGMLCASVWAKGIIVELNTAQITMGQQVRLTVAYDPNEAKGTPDFRGLQKEFEIVGTEQAKSYTVVNGQAHSIEQWGILLEPKHSGMITIPAFRIGSLTSVPLQLNVNPSSPKAAQRTTADNTADDEFQNDVLLTVHADNNQPYLNQEVLYKVSLLTRHPLINVRYQPPQVDNAILFPIGEGQQSQTIRDGVPYQLEEQVYAIFPQKSGPLSIIPPSLKAVRYANIPESVALTGDTVTIDVQPLPKQVKRRDWLPSKLLRLQETYDNPVTELEEGATVVRHITLQAQGLVAQLLPQIVFPHNSDVRAYPGQPELDNRVQQGALWGRAKIKITYVFPHPGSIDLPAIQVPWFNVKTQKFEIATLPAKTYRIRAASSVTKVQPPKSVPKKLVQVAQPKHMTAPKPSTIQPIIVLWVAGLMSALFGLWGLWTWQMRRLWLLWRLRAACMSNNIDRIKAALVMWGRQQWPNQVIEHIIDILNLLNQEQALYPAVQALVAVIYHPESLKNWQGADLWRAIGAYKKQLRIKPVKPTPASVLPPIYPPRN